MSRGNAKEGETEVPPSLTCRSVEQHVRRPVADPLDTGVSAALGDGDERVAPAVPLVLGIPRAGPSTTLVDLTGSDTPIVVETSLHDRLVSGGRDRDDSGEEECGEHGAFPSYEPALCGWLIGVTLRDRIG